MLKHVFSVPSWVRVFTINGLSILSNILIFYLYWYDYVVFVFVNMMYHIDWLQPSLWTPGRIQFDHGAWSFLCAVGFDLLIFFENFCIYSHQRYWPVIFLFGNIFVWFRYQGDDSFLEWLGVFSPLQSFGRTWEGLI